MSDRVLRPLVAALILMIAPPGATAADGECTKAPPALGRFEPDSGSPPPETPFLVDGEGERTLADFAGRALLVNLWATWCAPCVTEMPALDRLSAQVKDDNIAVLPLSADREGAPVIKAFFAANGISHLPVMVDRMGKVARALAVPGLPTTVLYDREGREVGRVIGIAEWDAPEALRFLRGCLAPAA
jgi:thiol-disulfide isomerase/thioredoxin